MKKSDSKALSSDRKTGFTVDRKALVKGLACVTKCIPANPVLPILNCVRMGWEKGGLCLDATNLDVFISTEIQIENTEGRAVVCVSAKAVLSVVQSMRSEQVVFRMDHTNLILEASEGMYTFACTSEDDFPPTPDLGEVDSFSLPQDELKKAISTVICASSEDTSRIVLNAVYFDPVAKDKIALVCTDGTMLGMKNVHNEANIKPFSLPRDAALLLTSSLGSEGDVRCVVVGTKFRACFDETKIVISLREGTFPNYKQVIPLKGTTHFSLERDSLEASLQRLSFVTDRAIKMVCSKKEIKLSGSNAGVSNKGEETLAIEDMMLPEGEKEIIVSFDIEKMVRVCSSFDAGKLLIDFMNDLTPVRLTQGDVLFIVMPMKIQ